MSAVCGLVSGKKTTKSDMHGARPQELSFKENIIIKQVTHGRADAGPRGRGRARCRQQISPGILCVRASVVCLPAPTGRHSGTASGCIVEPATLSMRQRQTAGRKACTADAGEGMGMGIACNARPSTSTNATTWTTTLHCTCECACSSWVQFLLQENVEPVRQD